MKQQQLRPSRGLGESKPNVKSFDLLNTSFVITYQPVIYSHETHLNAEIQITPKKDLINTPLQIELRGYSHIQTINRPQSKHSDKSLQITEDFLNQSDQKLQINVLMGESKNFESIQSDSHPKSRALDQMNEDARKQGQYFLEGCNVLYQINEQTGARLETLLTDQKYHYPVNFSLPKRLPNSVDHIILKDIHVIIKYTLEIKLILVDKLFGKKECQAVVIPFEIHDSEKQYPYEQLAVRELIRCYHAEGKKRDEVMSRPFAKLINYLCPRIVYDSYLQHHNHFKSSFKNYDLYHLQLVAIVNKGNHIFIVVRAYQQPDSDSLTFNREKNDKIDKKSMIKEVNSLGEVPNDISLVSMKHTQRKNIGLGVHKVQVQMIGELVGICSHPIFKKIITLNQSNYDMVEGQAMINMGDYMSFTRSCANELFTLRYYFNIKAIFQEDEGEGPQTISFQTFVVQSHKKDLTL